MEKCEKCLYYKSKEKCGECGRLSNVMDNKPMFTPNTNYNRIKSMSVEEMAEFNVTHDAENNMYLSLNGFLYGTKEVATEKNIQWLLEEVSKDEETNG